MTQNKILLFLILPLLTTSVLAQNNTSSTYSRFGIGLIESKADATTAGMGYAGVSLGSTGYLNNLNPASYSTLDSSRFMFNIQGKTSLANYSTSSSEQSNFDANIESLGIGFRAGKRWGMGFSISPYSSIGYTINGEKYILGTIDKYPVQYLGEGGVTQISWYNGVELVKGLSLGVTASYLWGSSDLIEVSYYPSLIGQTTFNERNYHLSTLLFEYGLQWQQKLGANTLSVGATMNMSAELDTYYKQRIYNSQSSDLSSATKNIDNYLIPMSYQAGLAYQNYKGWTVAGDIRYSNWTNSELPITHGQTRDTYGGSLGIQYTPTRHYRSFFKRMHYRIGTFYNQEYLSIQGQDIDSKGLTAGVTLPMRGSSRINLAYEYKETGTRAVGLVRERYHTIRIGLTFNENWFQKTQFK